MINIFDNWVFYVIFYLVFAVSFNQFYKLSTKKRTKTGALTILLQLIGAFSVLFLIPFFEIKFSGDFKIYIMLFAAVIFYAISDRLNTTVRTGVEVSVYSIISQLSTVFMIVAGLLFFKEPFILSKIIGSILIIASNVLIFYKKGKFHFNKYVGIAVLSQIAFSFALFFDVNISSNFNLAMYTFISLFLPAIFIILIERIKISDIVIEYKNGDKKSLWITGVSWGLMIICGLRSFQLGQVTTVAALFALTVLINVLIGYAFLKEKDSLLKKIIAAIVIIISVWLINK